MSDARGRQPGRRWGRVRCRALSLVELLIVIAIIALLISILLPSLHSAREYSRQLVCSNHLRNAAFDFRLFADAYAAVDRGDSEVLYGRSRFSADDFIQSLYGVSEFAGGSHVPFERVPLGGSGLECPSAEGRLWRIHGVPSQELRDMIAPAENVSYALNRRLRYAPVCYGDIPVLRPVEIDERVLSHPHVPLMFDVDAPAMMASAVRHEMGTPFYSAPSGSATECNRYAGDRYWFPAKRHRGKVTIGFVGGHVISTSDPLADLSWDWDYHPPIR